MKTATPKGHKAYKFNAKAEWRIFSWCLLLALILWILTGLSENYVRVINVRTSYINLPKDKVFTHPLPEELKVQVSATGWDLFSIWLRGNAEDVNIDMGQYYKKYYLLTNNRLKEEIRSQFSHKMIINNIEPDTIYLAKEPKMSRQIPVILKIKVNCEKGYGIGEKIKINPDHVTVTGPRSLVEQVEFAETSDSVINGIDKDISIPVRLKAPASDNLDYDLESVMAKAVVSELVEDKANIAVRLINTRGKKIKSNPKYITVIYSTTKSKLHHIKTSQFEVVADASKADSTDVKPLPVKLINHPEFTYDFKLKPETVKLEKTTK